MSISVNFLTQIGEQTLHRDVSGIVTYSAPKLPLYALLSIVITPFGLAVSLLCLAFRYSSVVLFHYLANKALFSKLRSS